MSAPVGTIEENPDDDVRAEQIAAQDPPEDSFTLSQLAKSYYVMGLGSRNLFVRMLGLPGHVALRDFSLVMKKGQCVALLGHNGAGKSTMLSIVTGKIDADRGDIVLNRRVINPDYIYQHLGICPQFDMLFGSMTVYEHLDLYIGLRGENLATHWDVIKTRIDAFRMTGVLNRRSEALSGGMKRRLSVLLATLGDPEIVLMDEPTTGMDPVNRRFVWKFLAEYKIKRQLLLTTHSMEEAEYLGDRIAILRTGRLVAVGTTSHLKEKYDIGYRMTFNTNAGFEEMAFHTVQAQLPGAQLDSVHGGCLRICMPAVGLPKMIEFLTNIETFTTQNWAGEMVPIFTDWTFTQMTLEDVFYRLNANIYEKKEVSKFASLKNPVVPPSPMPMVNATFPQQAMNVPGSPGLAPPMMSTPPMPGIAPSPQAYPPQGYPPQGYSQYSYPPQGYPQQGYPPQGYPPQGYPPQGYPPQGYPPPYGYPPQGYPPQGHPSQGYPPQGYPPQGYPPQGPSPSSGSSPQQPPPSQ